MPISQAKFDEMLEQLKVLEDEMRSCVETGVLNLDMEGARAPSLLVGLAAKLIVDHCQRQGRLKSSDILQGIGNFAEMMRIWGLHFGRQAQLKELKKEQDK